MSQRKLARKTEQGSARKLHLVPDPKPAPAPRRRRRKRSWKLGRVRKLKYQQHLALHAYEDELILRVIAEQFDGQASPALMAAREPGRWHVRELTRAMSRMNQQAKLYALSGRRSWAFNSSRNANRTYTLHPPTPVRRDDNA